jgi:hypothetical protein
MASRQYQSHFLIWKAIHDELTDTWIPDINILWKVATGY